MQHEDLRASRWAPSSARSSTPRSNYPSSYGLKTPNRSPVRQSQLPPPSPTKVERSRQSQLRAYQTLNATIRRLKWRSTTLLFCHHRALHAQTDNVIYGHNFPISSDDGRANAAEIMFKLDFFEFYTLLERCLLALMECFRIVISAEKGSDVVPPPSLLTGLERSFYAPNTNGTTKDSIIGDSRAFHGSSHRFHANLLSALDHPSNPLHVVLGTGDVRSYLGIAKEFRNKWKEADMVETQDEDDMERLRKRYKQILDDLQLDRMLATILLGLDEAKTLARHSVSEENAGVEVDMLGADEMGEMILDDAMNLD